MVDLDPQGNASTGIGIDKGEIGKSVYDLLIDQANLNDVVIKTKFKNSSLSSFTKGFKCVSKS